MTQKYRRYLIDNSFHKYWRKVHRYLKSIGDKVSAILDTSILTSLATAHRPMQSELDAIAHPSVRLQLGWISRKRLKIGLCIFHRTLAPIHPSYFLWVKFHPELLTGSSCFLALCVSISRNGRRYVQSYS